MRPWDRVVRLGTRVNFRNEDAVYHNVFSLSAQRIRSALTIDADRSLPAFVPDKAGKPRRPQLDY